MSEKTCFKTKIYYQHLEYRPHRWRQQAYLKGRNMTVWHLLSGMLTNGYSPTEAAENFDLPLEAIAEALLYYAENRKLIDADLQEEWKRLSKSGILKEEA